MNKPTNKNHEENMDKQTDVVKFDGWGNSTTATSYVWERVNDILADNRNSDIEIMRKELANFRRELAHNFSIDTGLEVSHFFYKEEEEP
tara:strand:+ start:283 stop:549 length:267 start_codon:yes stop_codon:yes gene_type:complete